MNEAEPPTINAHEDVALFREAAQFTAAESGFLNAAIGQLYVSSTKIRYERNSK
jgi:hypothetical protein